MSLVEVVDWSPRWAEQYDEVAGVLRDALAGVPSALVEHVGSTSVTGLGVAGREAFHAPDTAPRRHVYVCVAGTTNVLNHLAVRDVLRTRDDLRDAYSEVKLALAADPGMDIDTYVAGKSEVLQQVLEASGEFTHDELRVIRRLNDPDA